MNVDGQRQRRRLPTPPMLRKRLDNVAGTRIHDKVLADLIPGTTSSACGSKTAFIRGLIQVAEGSIGDKPEWQSSYTDELLVQRHYLCTRSGSYSLRITNARSTFRHEACPLPIGRNFKNLGRRERHLDLAVAVRVVSHQLSRFLALVNWHGTGGSVRMRNLGEPVNFEWSHLEVSEEPRIDGGDVPMLSDSDAEVLESSATDVLREWGLGSCLAKSSLGYWIFVPPRDTRF